MLGLWGPPLPLLWEAPLALPAMAPSPSDSLYTAISPSFAKARFKPPAFRRAARSRLRKHAPAAPTLQSLPARCLQRHLLHFTALPVTRRFGKQRVPGSSCTSPLRELLHNQGDCLNKRTVFSSDVNFSFSLAQQRKLGQSGGAAWVMSGDSIFPALYVPVTRPPR